MALVADAAPVLRRCFAPATRRILLRGARAGRHAQRRAGAGGRRHGVRFFPDGRTEAAGAAAEPSSEEITLYPRIGSLALRLCRVADGSLDAAFAGGQSRDWDLAAADLIVQEADGRMTALSGDAIVYNRRDVMHGVLVAAGHDRHAESSSISEITRLP